VCSKCTKGISASHWVRKARDHVYHLACFRCDACDRQLNTGEEFALHEGRVLCKPHYLDIVDGGTTSSSGIVLPHLHLLISNKRIARIEFGYTLYHSYSLDRLLSNNILINYNLFVRVVILYVLPIHLF